MLMLAEHSLLRHYSALQGFYLNSRAIAIAQFKFGISDDDQIIQSWLFPIHL